MGSKKCEKECTKGMSLQEIRAEAAPNSQNPKPNKGLFLMGVTDTETGMLPDDFQKRNMRSKI